MKMDRTELFRDHCQNYVEMQRLDHAPDDDRIDESIVPTEA